MSKLKFLTLMISAVCLISCSKDSSNNDNNGGNGGNGGSGMTFQDVTFIGEVNGDVFQTDFTDVTDDSETEVEFNLTSDLGLMTNYDYFNREGDLLTFYRDFPNLQVFQKNLATQSTFTGEDLCPLDPDEFELFATNSSDRIIIVTLEPNLQLFVRIYNPANGECVKVFVGEGFSGTCCTAAMVHNNSVYIKHANLQFDNRLARIDLSTLQVEDEIIFTDNISATFRDNELLVFFLLGGYNIYDADTFDLISDNTSLSGISGINFANSLFKTQFQGNKMLVGVDYIQPSPIAQGPGLLNLSTGNIEEGADNFFVGLVSDVSDELGVFLQGVSAWDIDLETGQIVCSTQNFTVPPQNIVLVYTNFDGDIEKTIQLSYLPDEIFIR